MIEWYDSCQGKTITSEIRFVNFAGAGYPDINYEVEEIINGKRKTLFVDESDVIRIITM